MINLQPTLSPLIGRDKGQTSQSELARRSGIAQPHISAWLSGARPLSLEQQIKLAESLGCRVRLTCTRPRSC